MTDLLERALDKLRLLPPSRQDEIASMLLILAEQEPGDYDFSDEDLTRIGRGLAEADAGRFMSEDEIAALFRKFRP